MPILLFGRYGSTNVLFFSSNFGSKLLAIQLQLSGKNSVSALSMYTLMLIAKPSDPKTFPDFKVIFKFFCHKFQQVEFFSREKTPTLI